MRRLLNKKTLFIIAIICASILGLDLFAKFVFAAAAPAELPFQTQEAQTREDFIALCQSSLTEAAAIPCVPIPMTGVDCQMKMNAEQQAQKFCTDQASDWSATKEAMAMVKKQQREEWWDKMKDELRKSIAGAFKQSLELFARQVARDTATWVASGGKGQKPLFVTEGWGAYLQNTADAALGNFIDQIGQHWGIDLCKPSFGVRIAIQAGLKQLPKVRCTFTQMMNNWQSAINNVNFSSEYMNALNPGENDISVAIKLMDQKNTYVANAVTAASKDTSDDGWKAVKKYTGYILTPGSVVHDTLSQHTLKTSQIGMETFTNTIWDFVGEFLNTLVAQLLKQLQSGLFNSTPGGNKNNPLNLPSLPALFNPYAAPIVEGISGAEQRFKGLVEAQVKTGDRYDILNKLTQCSEDAKNNPGPTDCVIDQPFMSAIKAKNFVNDLPEDIKNRHFSPIVNKTNSLENEIPYRSILILRKYRIVPVGWEAAAAYIQKQAVKDYTLAEVMAGYNDSASPFYHLVDPYWVLKAPELFCRRQGYGANNSAANDQSGTISRNEYCADEQQCLREDPKGNCQAYGYCTEERRLWDVGTPCDSRFNTCQTFTRTAGGENAAAQSYLANSLDFNSCNVNNAGCRWYSALYNVADKDWRHTDSETVIKESLNPATPLNVLGHIVQEWHQISTDKQLKLAAPCTEDYCQSQSGCSFDTSARSCSFPTSTAQCTPSPNGLGCRVEACLSPTDNLSSLNGNFENQAAYAFDADKWTDEYSYLDYNNRDYRSPGDGRNGSAALKLVANVATGEIIMTLPNITLANNKNYHLKFYLKGNSLTSGSLTIGVYSGSFVLAGSNWEAFADTDWHEYDFEFSSGNNTSTEIRIITSAGATLEAYLDDFSLQQVLDDCANNSLWLYNKTNPDTAAEIYFNRNVQTCTSQAQGCTQFVLAKTLTADEVANKTYNVATITADKLAYLKQAPDYYSCYKDDSGNWADRTNLESVLAGQDPLCAQFAPVCTADEVGCEMYTPINGDPKVPGVVSTTDYCPRECAGYQVYEQQATDFTSAKFRQFIANTIPKYCSAQYAGCDEFTNLDELGRGAEAREYYVHLKACQKPANDDGTYYTWEGNDTTGYQLQSFNLKQAAAADPTNDGHGLAPCVEISYQPQNNGTNRCSDLTSDLDHANDINLSGETSSPVALMSAAERYQQGICIQSDMADNPDCREFYDTSGNIHYRLLSKTITVSDNCHPYRRTQTEANTADAGADCQSSQGYFNPANECVYMAIPGEGTVCSADAAGCRAYTGNQGNNVRNVFVINDFGLSVPATSSWIGGHVSNVSTFPGGYSLTNDDARLSRPVTIIKNRAYTLSFWAKGNNDVTMDSIKFFSAPSTTDYFSSVRVAGNELLVTSTIIAGNEWRKYDLGPVFVRWSLPDNQTVYTDSLDFNISGGGTIFIDNVQLKEVQENIYLIENSWFTPVSCDNTLADPAGQNTTPCVDSQTGRCLPGEMLSCNAYTDRAGSTYYLRSFTRLCREKAVGCEALMDTFNNNYNFAQTYNGGDSSAVTVPADTMEYLVNDRAYACAAADMGCAAYGLPDISQYDEVLGYSTFYLKNRPDDYPNIMCRSDELWCDEYAGNNSFFYFKNPHGKVCEYGAAAGAASSSGWHALGSGQSCTTTLDQTYGTGYENPENKIQPIGRYDNALAVTNTAGYAGWAGACPAAQNSCTEYIDPLDQIYLNLIPNKCINAKTCSLKLKANTLYQATEMQGGILTADSSTCEFKTSTNGFYLNQGVSVSQFFYLSTSSADQEFCQLQLSLKDKNANIQNFITGSKISLAGVYYDLANSVDPQSCNGLVDFRTGCVLFNDRSNINYNESDLFKRFAKYLTFDSYATYESNFNGTPKAVSPVSATSQKDSNVVLKVAPDRACNAWLYCTTYQKSGNNVASTSVAQFSFENQDQCLRLGLCSDLDPNTGICTQLESRDLQEVATTTYDFPNLSGFSAYGLYPFSQMEQWGNAATVPNGNFVNTMPGSKEPLGWRMDETSSKMDVAGWRDYKYSIESDKRFQHYDTSYLRLNAAYEIISEPIEIEQGQDYIFTGWINTLYLQPLNANAEIWFSCDRGATWDTGANDCPRKIRLKAGLPWTRLSKDIKISHGNSIMMMLVNYVDSIVENNCNDLKNNEIGNPDYNTACDITGNSLFDDFALRPVLTVKNNIAYPSDWSVERTCRQYPAQDSIACQYTSNNQFYYGWYGYCLMADPQNISQCLQWLPLDLLKGDVVDEYTATYEDRVPLYYCVQYGTHRTSFDRTITLVKGGGSTAGTDVGKIATSLGLSQNAVDIGQYMTSLERQTFRYPFLDLPRPMFDLVGSLQFYQQYPFLPVQSLNYTGGLVVGASLSTEDSDVSGIGVSLTWGRVMDYYGPLQVAVNATVQTIINLVSSLVPGLGDLGIIATPYTPADFWGGWGVDYALGVKITDDPIPIYFLVPIPVSWSAVEPKLEGGLGVNTVSAVNDWIHNNMGDIEGALSLGVLGGKIVTDADGKYSGKFGGDPNPQVPGDILGLYWDAAYQNNPNSKTTIAGIMASANLQGQANQYYCTKFVEVVTPSGINKAWTNRVNRASQFGFITTGSKSDTILSNPYFIDGWKSTWPPLAGDTSPTQYWDGYSPKVRGFDIKGYNADYKPFGALVPPAADTQNPYLWDSLYQANDNSRQPLLWEPPTLQMQAPFQARMGQPLCYNTVRNLFARSFGVWDWQPSDSNHSEDAGNYVEKTTDPQELKYLWDLPTVYCPYSYVTGDYKYLYARGINTRLYNCLISPQIQNVSVIYNDQNVARLTFTVRVDKDQLPLTSYVIDWGDGYNDSVSGVQLRAKPNLENPFVFYHYYAEDKLKAASADCSSAQNYCFNISIKARDNWDAVGFYNVVFRNNTTTQSNSCTSVDAPDTNSNPTCLKGDNYPPSWDLANTDDLFKVFPPTTTDALYAAITDPSNPCPPGWSSSNVDGDGYCDWANGENFNVDPACPLKNGDIISLRVADTDLKTFLSVNGGCGLDQYNFFSGYHKSEELRANRLYVDQWEQFIIEKANGGDCPEGATNYGGDCLFFASATNDPIPVKLKSVRTGRYLMAGDKQNWDEIGGGALVNSRDGGSPITFNLYIKGNNLVAADASPTPNYGNGLNPASWLITRGSLINLKTDYSQYLNVAEDDMVPCNGTACTQTAAACFYSCTLSDSLACFAVDAKGKGDDSSEKFYVCNNAGKCPGRDRDGDGYSAFPIDGGQQDCNDNDRNIHPNAPLNCMCGDHACATTTAAAYDADCSANGIDADCYNGKDCFDADCKNPQCSQTNAIPGINGIERDPSCPLQYGDTIEIINEKNNNAWEKGSGDDLQMTYSGTQDNSNQMRFKLSGDLAGKVDGQKVLFGDRIKLIYVPNNSSVYTPWCALGIDERYSEASKSADCPEEGYILLNNTGDIPANKNVYITDIITLRSNKTVPFVLKGDRYVYAARHTEGDPRVWLERLQEDLDSEAEYRIASRLGWWNNQYFFCPDNDLDGFIGKGTHCENLTSQFDCNDSNPNIYPGAPEPPDSAIDYNCDGEINAFTPGNKFYMRVKADNLMLCDGNTYSNLYLSVNTGADGGLPIADAPPTGPEKGCHSGLYGLNLNRSGYISPATNSWETLKFSWGVDVDSNGVLSKGDIVKLYLGRNFENLTPSAPGSLYIHYLHKSGVYYLNADDSNLDIGLFRICDANGDCSYNSASPLIIHKNQPFCLEAKLSGETGYRFVSFVSDNDHNPLILGAEGAPCQTTFTINSKIVY